MSRSRARPKAAGQRKRQAADARAIANDALWPPIPSAAMWAIVIVIFALGVAGRVAALDLPRKSGGSPVTDSSRWHPAEFHRFLEQDEKIYYALVQQINAGRGYTLQGHPIMQERWLIPEQYGQALFYHPPGGPALFWVCERVFGARGFALAQVVSFAVFFWSLMWLGAILIRPFGGVAAIALAILGSMTPIMAFVAGRFWLDAPILAFSTLASAVFLSGVVRNRYWIIAAGGAVLGYAILIKLTSVLIVPGLVALAWALRPRESVRQVVVWATIFLAVAFVVQLPWEIWQWRVLGSPFPAWAGKPANRLVQSNPFVYFQTVVRTPWTYVELLPQVIWTLAPAFLLWWTSRRVRDVGWIGAGLVLWLVAVVGAHMVLGAMGFSKILRYIVLVTPAAALLFALGLAGTIDWIRARRKLGIGAILLIAIAAAGLGLEVAQGIKTSLVDNAQLDMIRPLTGNVGAPDQQ